MFKFLVLILVSNVSFIFAMDAPQENAPQTYAKIRARQERWERRSLANLRRNERERVYRLRAFVVEQRKHASYGWPPPF